MSNLRRRLEQLEQHDGEGSGEYRAWVYLDQDANDPELWRDSTGREYRQGEEDWPQKHILVLYHDGANLPRVDVALPHNGRDVRPLAN